MHFLNSSEKFFYGANTKFSKRAGQWIQSKTIKKGKQIHQKVRGNGGESKYFA